MRIRLNSTYRIVIAGLVLCCSIFHAGAQSRKYSNEFLHFGNGARGMGMGKAITALSTDAFSVYWNPANTILLASERQVALMHTSYFGGIGNFNAGAVSFRSSDRKSATSVAFVRFGIDDIPNTLELIGPDGSIRYDMIRPFSAVDQAFFLSYAHKLAPQGMSVGGNIKVIRRTAGDFASAWGFGLDLAYRYQTGPWHIAVVTRDITTTFNAWTFNTDLLSKTFLVTGNEIPESSTELTRPSVVLGFARLFTIKDNSSIALETDFEFTTDGKRNVLIPGNPISMQPSAGMEVTIAKALHLRAGVTGFQSETELDGTEYLSFLPTIGMGLDIQKFLSVDYAFTDPGNQSIALYSHVISLNINIFKKETEDGPL